MMDPKPAVIMLFMTLFLLFAAFATQCIASGRTFEQCQALAVERGAQIRYSGKVFQRYMRYKAAGTAINPKGLIARCMAGR